MNNEYEFRICAQNDAGASEWSLVKQSILVRDPIGMNIKCTKTFGC